MDTIDHSSHDDGQNELSNPQIEEQEIRTVHAPRTGMMTRVADSNIARTIILATALFGMLPKKAESASRLSQDQLAQATTQVDGLFNGDFENLKNGTMTVDELVKKVLGYISTETGGREDLKIVLFAKLLQMLLARGEAVRAVTVFQEMNNAKGADGKPLFDGAELVNRLDEIQSLAAQSGDVGLIYQTAEIERDISGEIVRESDVTGTKIDGLAIAFQKTYTDGKPTTPQEFAKWNLAQQAKRRELAMHATELVISLWKVGETEAAADRESSGSAEAVDPLVPSDDAIVQKYMPTANDMVMKAGGVPPPGWMKFKDFLTARATLRKPAATVPQRKDAARRAGEFIIDTDLPRSLKYFEAAGDSLLGDLALPENPSAQDIFGKAETAYGRADMWKRTKNRLVPETKQKKVLQWALYCYQTALQATQDPKLSEDQQRLAKKRLMDHADDVVAVDAGKPAAPATANSAEASPEMEAGKTLRALKPGTFLATNVILDHRQNLVIDTEFDLDDAKDQIILGNGGGVHLEIRNGVLQFGVRGKSDVGGTKKEAVWFVSTFGQVEPGHYHVTASFNAMSGQLTLHLNGAKQRARVITDSLASPKPLTILAGQEIKSPYPMSTYSSINVERLRLMVGSETPSPDSDLDPTFAEKAATKTVFDLRSNNTSGRVPSSTAQIVAVSGPNNDGAITWEKKGAK